MSDFRKVSDFLHKAPKHAGRDKAETISLTGQVFATWKNRDKIKDFRDQRDKGECQHTWVTMCYPEHSISYLWFGIFNN